MNEVCPSCGGWVDMLDEVTGWCDECIAILCDSRRCTRCDTIRHADLFRPTKYGTKTICKPCERERRYQWRLANPEREAATELRRQLRKVARATSTAPPFGTIQA